MPLVDYASSDEGSGNDSEVEEEEKEVFKNNQPKPVPIANTNTVSDTDANGELFTSLPKPRKTFSFLEDDNKLSKLLLNKNSLPSVGKESVKISVPSVAEFEDKNGEPSSKKLKPSAKGTGLFSVLPPPKNNSIKHTFKNFVPNVVSKNQGKSPSQIKSQAQSKITNHSSIKTKDVGDDDDDDAAVGTSFFGLDEQNSHTEQEQLSTESHLVEESSSTYAVPGNSFVELPTTIQNPNLTVNVDEGQYSYSTDSPQAPETVSASNNPLDLDEKALQILCGNKKKRQNMPMNVIDLSGEEVLPDSKEWLLKQFTEEKRGRSGGPKKGQGFSSQSRRKHQITYLAYQAKEQELELKNQWAQNRISRKQTQSKYGF